MPVLTDEEYYRAVPRESVAERLLVAARDRIFLDFSARMRPSPSDRILDVGVSDVVNAGANFLERSYPHQSNITACGLGEGIEFQDAFPAVRYVRIEPNVRLPFDDGSFDVATSNAVLEHVGSWQNQCFFVSELCRVAARVFISVPNRLFPMEHHTALPIVHYVDGLFQIACRLTGQSQWAQEEKSHLDDGRAAAATCGAHRQERADWLHGPDARPVFLELISSHSLVQPPGPWYR